MSTSRRYVVIRFSVPVRNIEEYEQSVPESWIQCRDTNGRVFVAYPDERPETICEFVENYEKCYKCWPIYRASVLHTTDSYSNAKDFILNLANPVTQADADDETVSEITNLINAISINEENMHGKCEEKKVGSRTKEKGPVPSTSKDTTTYIEDKYRGKTIVKNKKNNVNYPIPLKWSSKEAHDKCKENKGVTKQKQEENIPVKSTSKNATAEIQDQNMKDNNKNKALPCTSKVAYDKFKENNRVTKQKEKENIPDTSISKGATVKVQHQSMKENKKNIALPCISNIVHNKCKENKKLTIQTEEENIPVAFTSKSATVKVENQYMKDNNKNKVPPCTSKVARDKCKENKKQKEENTPVASTSKSETVKIQYQSMKENNKNKAPQSPTQPQPSEDTLNLSEKTVKYFKPSDSCIKKEGLVKWIPEYVYIKGEDFEECKQKSANPVYLARALMEVCFTEKALKECTLLKPKGEKNPLFRPVVKAIVKFVEEYSSKKEWVILTEDKILDAMRYQLTKKKDSYSNAKDFILNLANPVTQADTDDETVSEITNLINATSINEEKMHGKCEEKKVGSRTKEKGPVPSTSKGTTTYIEDKYRGKTIVKNKKNNVNYPIPLKWSSKETHDKCKENKGVTKQKQEENIPDKSTSKNETAEIQDQNMKDNNKNKALPCTSKVAYDKFKENNRVTKQKEKENIPDTSTSNYAIPLKWSSKEAHDKCKENKGVTKQKQEENIPVKSTLKNATAEIQDQNMKDNNKNKALPCTSKVAYDKFKENNRVTKQKEKENIPDTSTSKGATVKVQHQSMKEINKNIALPCISNIVHDKCKENKKLTKQTEEENIPVAFTSKSATVKVEDQNMKENNKNKVPPCTSKVAGDKCKENIKQKEDENTPVASTSKSETVKIQHQSMKENNKNKAPQSPTQPQPPEDTLNLSENTVKYFKPSDSCIKKEGLVKWIPEYVYIKGEDFEQCKQKSANPVYLARALMEVCFTEKALKECTLLKPKAEKNPLFRPVVEAIVKFVKEYSSKKEWEILTEDKILDAMRYQLTKKKGKNIK